MYLERAELPDIRLYDLRNTFATLWLESGAHPKILQEILGHSLISITLATYSHVAPHMQREATSCFFFLNGPLPRLYQHVYSI